MGSPSGPTGAQGNTPTWMDHHELRFWLWASIRDASKFLDASRALGEAGDQMFPPADLPAAFQHAHMMSAQAQMHQARDELEIEKYHFVTTLGMTLRTLKRAQNLFPSIQTQYSKSTHLLREAVELRNMIEHADAYLVGKGHKQSDFSRESELLQNFPGDTKGTADATSLISDVNGHWIGGRLNVELALAELRSLAEEASKIPPP